MYMYSVCRKNFILFINYSEEKTQLQCSMEYRELPHEEKSRLQSDADQYNKEWDAVTTPDVIAMHHIKQMAYHVRNCKFSLICYIISPKT